MDVCDFIGDPINDDTEASSNEIWILCGFFISDPECITYEEMI